jgi:Spy/CpxP family protein refolding chaperone
VNTWKIIFATMVIFGTGVVTGGLLVRHSEKIRGPRAHNPAAAHPSPNITPGGVRFELLRRAQRELDLTLEQRQEIDRIITASQERTKKLMEPISPKMREELQQAKEEFRAVLTPAQKNRFDDLLKQQQRSREQRRPATNREHATEL